MSTLIQTLNEQLGKTPDEIVSGLMPKFVIGEHIPWVAPRHLHGRKVLIEYGLKNRDGSLRNHEWWLASGEGSRPTRAEAVPWDIEKAFRRLEGYPAATTYVALHLIGGS